MAEKVKKPENSFEISVTIQEIGLTATKDVNEFRAIRVPIKKHGSFAAIILPIPLQKYKHLEDLEEQSNLLGLTLEIYMTDSKEAIPNTRSYKRTKHVISKSYTILSCESIDSNHEPQNQWVVTRLLLINPILMAMNNTSGFNKIIDSKTGMEAIEEFEGWLPGEYGDTAFEFKKVGEGENLNTYSYEQIMLRQEGDISVPRHLLIEKKALNSYAYYFFDDFRITPDKSGDICGILVNLINKDLFTPTDVYGDKYKDIQGLNLIKTQPLNNPFGSTKQGTQRVVIKDATTSHKRNDDPSPVPVTQMKTVASPAPVSQDRPNNAGTSSISTKDKDIKGVRNIYAPDDAENASARNASVGAQQQNTLRSKQFYEVKECLPETFQFDRIFNLDEHERSSYIHVPISIINIFRKESNNETKMKHGVQVQAFKFAPE